MIEITVVFPNLTTLVLSGLMGLTLTATLVVGVYDIGRSQRD